MTKNLTQLDELDELIENMCMHSQKNADGVVTIIYEGLSPAQAKAAIKSLMLAVAKNTRRPGGDLIVYSELEERIKAL